MRTPRLAFTAPLLLAAACGGAVDPSATRCSGSKCDGNGVEALQAAGLRDLLRCWSGSDGALSCQLRDRRLPGGVEVSYWAAVWRADSGVRSSNLFVRRDRFSTAPVALEAIPATAFPGTLNVGVAVTAPDNGTYDFGFERHFSSAAELAALREEAPFKVDLPLEVWPVRVWPKDDAVDAMVVGYDAQSSFPIGDSRLPYSVTPRQTSVDQRLSAVHQKGDAWTTFGVLVPLTGAAPTLDITIINLDDGSQKKQTHAITAPGYYVVDGDAGATLTAPADLPNAPAAPDAPTPTPPVDNSNAPDMTPAPVDPCRGSCGATQVCVAGACVARDEQVQSSSCYPAYARCDAGESSDCAEGHACVNGLCTRLTCQTQSTSCYSPTAQCATAADCADGHSCVDGLCRRLTCQTQSSSCYSPTAPCAIAADCAADHACVAGLCRRLTCQTQSSSCYPPTAPCATIADCATGHTCDAGVCRRNGC